MIADVVPAAPYAAPDRQGRRLALILAGIGVAAYVGALIVTLPAKVALHWAGVAAAEDATGTVWNGAAPVGTGLTAMWRVAPLALIGKLAVAANLSVSGPQTRLSSRAAWRPGRLVFEDLDGRAGWPLIAAMAPRLPFACTLTFDVAMRRMVLAGASSGADGEMTSEGGACSSIGGGPSGPAVPPLIGRATMAGGRSEVWIAPLARRDDRLVEARVGRDGKLSVEIHPAATALLPAGGGRRRGHYRDEPVEAHRSTSPPDC